MVITPHFVMINFPKTGSTFARTVIRQAYERREGRLDRRLLRKLRLRAWPIEEPEHFNPIRGYLDQHGRVEQIPKRDRHKPIVSLARDPIERILSSYNHYLKTPHDQYLTCMNIVARHFAPDFPMVSLQEYCEFWKVWNSYWIDAQDLGIGPVTVEFLNFFSTDPNQAFRHLREHGDDIDGLLQYLPKRLTLLRNESLNQDIKGLLLRFGFREEEVAFIEVHPKIFPEGVGRFKGDITAHDIDHDLLNKLLDEESILYRIYERYGISYARNLQMVQPSFA